MPRITVDGLSLNYETMGSGGVPIFFMPGGRSSMELMRPIATPMSAHHRTYLYDRRNCGKSDVLIAGDISEQEIWADELAALIRQLGLQNAVPQWLVGRLPRGADYGDPAPRCRARPAPGLGVRRRLRGDLAGAELLRPVHRGCEDGRHAGGYRDAVLGRPYRRQPVEPRPACWSMDVNEFIATMDRWFRIFLDGADLPVIGATAERPALPARRSLPRGTTTRTRPRRRRTCTACIKGSILMPPPILRAEYDAMPSPEARDLARAERCAPMFLEYLEKVEGKVPSELELGELLFGCFYSGSLNGSDPGNLHPHGRVQPQRVDRPWRCTVR